jgi:hypothetical protein
MNGHRFVFAIGAGLGAWLFAGPAGLAAADTLPPGIVSAPGTPTGVIDFDDFAPYFQYHQVTWPYNVADDSGDIVGTFGVTRTSWGGGIPFLAVNDLRDEITDGTGSASAWTGSVDENFSLQTVAALGGYLTIFGNHYIQNPEGTSDYVTLFNNVVPLFDTFPQETSTAEATLGQLAGETPDLSSSFDTNAADTGWLADLGQLLDIGTLF